MNIFVSENLLKISEKIVKSNNKTIINNGVDVEKFYVYDENLKKIARNKYNINENIFNIAFIGNLFPIKNADLLPAIFSAIYNIENNVHFYIIGDGKLKDLVIKELTKNDIPYSFLGNKKQEEIPDLINVLDLVVLPSKNEGMPLIVLETIACGVKIITSRVGGIPEILNDEFTVELCDTFVEDFALKCIKILNNNINLSLEDKYKWCNISNRENSILKELLYI